MFYRPVDGHGLPHDPFSAIVAPRPIGWISTRDGTDNLAPYSFFNAVAYRPPQVMFASTSAKADRPGTKDTVANIRAAGCFCVNIVPAALGEAMNATSAAFPAGTDEFEAVGIEKAECVTIPCPRVAAAPAALECRLTRLLRLPGEANWVAFGAVTGVHVRDDALLGGRLDVTTYRPLARLGYHDYLAASDLFEMRRPPDP